MTECETTPPETATAQPDAPDACEYARLELMGHRQRVGQIREVSRFGTTLIRIDFWDSETGDTATEYYAGASIYCLSPVTRAVVEAYEEREKRRYAPHIRHLPAPVEATGDDDEGDEDQGGYEDPAGLDDPASEYNRRHEEFEREEF